MPDHQADPPADQTKPEAPPSAMPAPDGDAGTEDAFKTLPRRRFWRNHQRKPPATDFWWQRPENTEPENTEPENTEPEATEPEG